MSNRLKSLVIALGIFFIALALLYGVSAILVKPRLVKLEQKNIQQSTSRALDALYAKQAILTTLSADWSSWDDMYSYTVTHSQAFIDSNMTTKSLQNIDVNDVLIISPSGKLLFSKSIDNTGSNVHPLPAELTTAFKPGSPLLATNESSVHSGFLRLGSSTAIFASQPILNSFGEGPVRGTLVFVEPLDAAALATSGDQSKLTTRLFAANSVNLPKDVRAILPSLTTSRVTTTVLSSEYGAGYKLINDAYGKPTTIARVQVSRALAAQANASLNYYLIVAGFIALLMAILNGQAVRQIFNQRKTIEIKDEFFSVASHELRTPLTAIRGNSDLAKQMFGDHNPALTEMLDDIHESSERLIRIVTNFLDAARLEQGRITFEMNQFDARPVIEDVTSQLQGLAVQKKLYVRSEIPNDTALQVYADKDRVEEIIYNLLGNAVKYTEEGGITLSAQTKNNATIISVTDTGLGISDAGKKTLFTKFTQTRHDDLTKGSGLGLYITKQLIDKMNGKIWVESGEGGKGTKVSFSLPASATSKV